MSKTVRYWLLVIGHWSLVIGRGDKGKGLPMTKLGIAAVALALAGRAGPRPVLRAELGYVGPARQHRGLHRRRQGHRHGQAQRRRDRSAVSASSELTADAIVKYRDARRKLHDAFTALKLANVAVEERGLLVDQKGTMGNPYFFGGYQPNTRNKTEVQLSRKLVVKGTDIRKMDEDAVLQLVAKLLDVAQDAGGQVGPQQTTSTPIITGGTSRTTGWSASCSKTSTSCRKKLTRRRSPTRGRGPSGWPG